MDKLSHRNALKQTSICTLLQSGTLASLVTHTQSLANLNELLAHQLEPPLREHCRLANYQEGILTLLTQNGVWKSVLYYQIPELIKRLRGLEPFSEIKSVKIKVSLEGG